MKKIFICLLTAAAAITFSACKGKKTETNSADSGQVHVGNEGPADSAKIKPTPTETGGKDSSGQGQGTTNAPKDTLKTTP
ncbi:hypothetical protein [Mucilaginibacter glaciei]|uniref:Lipoprotein n=1 Tax=Mucilaginibacter glaciei TaxID=2772109 RepID=A0A926NRT9_9SPHI|nr:hypothetical protein [Mucilaginibacter glaciei]MBD1393560.1 hypothetical protein [Mucilaginibacter glaciei]